MESIYIPHLLAIPENTQEIPVEVFLPNLETLTPVRGRLQVKHGQTYLEVSAEVEAIATLVCDRCLQHYNHRLQVKTTELIWLDEETEPLPQEREVRVGDLSEVLSPKGYFDPEMWLYEQLSLAMPLQKTCGEECQGITQVKAGNEPIIDRRWSGLDALKAALDES
ncbi:MULTISPECIES: YceD family protein [Spirulina sp. CCY15215]|uniref:YceD family protein n=1 Tax=Spirulina sp. CCY15215 TaxID=2767591 RepID=UPI001950E146|nr:YceD family protein [Spirulina major]